MQQTQKLFLNLHFTFDIIKIINTLPIPNSIFQTLKREA